MFFYKCNSCGDTWDSEHAIRKSNRRCQCGGRYEPVDSYCYDCEEEFYDETDGGVCPFCGGTNVDSLQDMADNMDPSWMFDDDDDGDDDDYGRAPDTWPWDR